MTKKKKKQEKTPIYQTSHIRARAVIQSTIFKSNNTKVIISLASYVPLNKKKTLGLQYLLYILP